MENQFDNRTSLLVPGNNVAAPGTANKFETTYKIGFDTLVIPLNTAIATDTLFDANVQKSTLLRNTTFQAIAQTGEIKIQYIKATSVLNFTTRGTAEPIAVQQSLFENLSLITLTINNKAYDNIPLANFLPYSWQYVAGTATTVQKTNFEAFELPGGGFEIPQNNSIAMGFLPPAGQYTAGDGATNVAPVLPGGVRAWFIKFELWGTIYRPLA